MQGTKRAKERRDKLAAAPIRQAVADRLQRYIDSIAPRPVKADVVTIAVTEWLDRQELAKGN